MTVADRPARRRRYRLWLLLIAVLAVAITVLRSRLSRPSVPGLVEPAAAPVAAEPIAAEPVAAEPVAAEPVAAEPIAAGDDAPTQDDPPEGRYGPGSAASLAGGAAPHPAFIVKGNEDSMLYHTVKSPYYGRTKAEQWFVDEATAQAAGFRRWNAPRG